MPDGRDLNRLLETLLGPPVPPQMAHQLRDYTARLCQMNHDRFPGAQPVSFVKSDIARLQKKDYWVCEKSDGVRVLMLVVKCEDNTHEVFLFDRHNAYRKVSGFYFPHYEDPGRALGNSVFDGELLIDVDPKTGKETTRLLVFDCLVCDDQNLMSKPLLSRYGRLQNWLLKPFSRMLKQMPHLAKDMPFELGVKKMELSYGIPLVLKEYIPRLHHGSDGLIFTCVETGYVPGTDTTLLKWKPPSENSIDFKLEVRFPPDQNGSRDADSRAVPLCVLLVWCGGSVYEYFDVLELDEDEWAAIKASNTQYDDRIVEVHWDSERQRWKFMRFRNDKPNGNHRDTVDSIINSIIDGVKEDELIAAAPTIREAWKARERARGPSAPSGPPHAQNGRHPPPAPPQSHQHHHRPPPPQQPDVGRGTIRPGKPYHVANRFSKVGGPKEILGWKR
ncbi:mRNA capping enzyme [Exidia glandulosa HHB12029]|uniref:mRNA-capping enzyme subunit alpha n=1 Tax=Exidia glandulosa HHB12029 TaxID=1314781 RepID=A0A165DD53_EXIGL|nr:mRNA capping enzyme [Exidia glandulosa HHB12029]